jgi:hypothetical protein
MTALEAILDRSVWLRRVLIVDAATCLATGLLTTLFAAPLSTLLGLPAALLFYAGLALFPIAAFMAWLAMRRDLSRAGAWLVVLGNAGWVAGSVLVLCVFSPTGLGTAFVIAQAAVVALLAELELTGLRRIAS